MACVLLPPPSVRALLLTNLRRTRALLRRALPQLHVQADLAANLDDATTLLDSHPYDVAIIDLFWDENAGLTLANWVHAYLIPRKVRIVLGPSTPLAKNLEAYILVPEATLLGRSYNLLDLAEAIGQKLTKRTERSIA